MQRVKSQRRLDLLLDSGAFSAWARQDDIQLETYIDYLKQHRRCASAYLALDKIPGRFKAPATATETDEAARISYQNLQVMKAAGLTPIPVFHQGEDFDWLIRLIEDGEDYIGISPRDFSGAQAQQAWFDKVFTLITDRDGHPMVRTHGLGVTKVKFLLRYPFTTVDSTRWTLDAGYGHILLPQWRNGGFDYLQPPHIVATTGVDSKVNARKQVRGFGDATTQHIEDYVTGLGLTLEQLRDDRLGRIRTYLHYYQQLAQQLPPVRFSDFDTGLFLPNIKTSLREPLSPSKLKIYVATFCRGVDVRVVDAMGIKTRLLSYYELRNQEANALYDYVRDGYLPTRRNINRRSRSADETDRPPWQA